MMTYMISFIADVTEHSEQQGKDYTTKKRVTLEVDHNKRVTLFDVYEIDEESAA